MFRIAENSNGMQAVLLLSCLSDVNVKKKTTFLTFSINFRCCDVYKRLPSVSVSVSVFAGHLGHIVCRVRREPAEIRTESV